MIVRFATTCDMCGARSEEYTAHPSCRECLRDICRLCAEPDTLIETDGGQPETVKCPDCVGYERKMLT